MGFISKHKKAFIIGVIVLIIVSLVISTSIMSKINSQESIISAKIENNQQLEYDEVRDDSSRGVRGSGSLSLMSFGSGESIQDEYETSSSSNSEDLRKIKKTVNSVIIIPKSEIHAKFDELNNFISTNNGYITSLKENKQTIQEKEYVDMDFSFRIPVDKFDFTVSFLRSIGKVNSLNIVSQDLTESYTDTESWVESTAKEKARIEQLLSKAETLEEILIIEDKLSALQRSIDNYQKRLLNIDRETDYSLFSVSLREEREIGDVIVDVKKEVTPFGEFLKVLAKSFSFLLLFVAVLIGFLVPLIILGFIVLFVVRKVKR